MEHIDGEPIDRYCNQSRLPVDARLTLFRKVCEAVQYADQSLVVHRDLKSSNILVTAAGEPKLLDFGIAKLLKAELAPEPHEPTAAWQLPLTRSYASSEQVRGKLVTTASDVYSLGVLLYQLLTGRLPHRLDDRSPREIERILTERDPPRPSAAVADPTAGVVASASPCWRRSSAAARCSRCACARIPRCGRDPASRRDDLSQPRPLRPRPRRA